MPNNYELLEILSRVEGYDTVEEMLSSNAIDSVVPGICPICEYTTSVEPDCTRGYCEECNKGTVKSCMILAGVI